MRLSPFSRQIWEQKYRLQEAGETGVAHSWDRVAAALAAVEQKETDLWQERFRALLEDFGFLPGGRILAGAGSPREVTLLNCFVMGRIEDSLDGIFSALREGALTMQQGGGVGYDFSSLRPAGMPALRAGTIASGPLSFMRIWDAMCETLVSSGNRRGAMMATLRVDHPDIEAFVDAKCQPGELTHFNLSVQVTDAFMQAVERDESWPLVFPEDHLPPAEGTTETLVRQWDGQQRTCRVTGRISARKLWQRITRASYECAEPGVLFIDRINRENNLAYCESITATNPCGEIPLPPYGACDLGSFNLTAFVHNPFESNARFDWDGLRSRVPTAVRFLDNVLDASRYPLTQQAETARRSRRIGLGITGLGDALIMLGLRYGEPRSLDFAEQVMQLLNHEAYRASAAIAREKGAFPAFEAEPYLQQPCPARLPDDIRQAIAQHGIRNSHLLAIAPTGTISLLADNVSSGVEPVFKAQYERRVRVGPEQWETYQISDHACGLWQEDHPDSLPPAYVDALSLPPETHLAMQARLQPYVDNAISKTINVPVDMSFEDYQAVYDRAYRLGLKGCTTFRPTPVRGSILSAEEEVGSCCGPDSLDAEPPDAGPK